MKYSDETVGAIQKALPYLVLSYGDVCAILEALESTAEQKALRAGAKVWADAVAFYGGEREAMLVLWGEERASKALKEFDKARGA